MKKVMLALAAASTLAIPSVPAEARHHSRHHTTYYTTDNGIRYWRGDNGRYYCRRGNGTVGLLIGGAAGALIGRAVDGGRNHTTGTIVGAAAGALLGREVARNNTRARCR